MPRGQETFCQDTKQQNLELIHDKVTMCKRRGTSRGKGFKGLYNQVFQVIVERASCSSFAEGVCSMNALAFDKVI